MTRCASLDIEIGEYAGGFDGCHDSLRGMDRRQSEKERGMTRARAVGRANRLAEGEGDDVAVEIRRCQSDGSEAALGDHKNIVGRADLVVLKLRHRSEVHVQACN